MFSGIKNFFEVLPPAVGLDISDSSIKYAQLERKGRYFNLLAYGERDIPKGIVESGRIQDPKMLSEILEETLVKNKPSGLSSYVVASIPDEEIFLKVITLPNVPKKEIKNMILVEAERNIPIPADNMQLDYEVINFHPERKHMDVLLAAAKKKEIATYIESIKGAGLHPLALDPEVAAIARSTVKGQKTKRPIIILEIGANRTRVIVYVKNVPIITGAVDFSAPDITKTMASVLGISEAEARDVEWSPKLLSDEKLGQRLTDALHPLYSDLVEAIKKYATFLEDREDGQDLDMHKVEKILISGGGARIPGIANSLSIELQIPTEIANPWVNVLPPALEEIPELSRREAVRFSATLGLALYGLTTDIRKIYPDK